MEPDSQSAHRALVLLAQISRAIADSGPDGVAAFAAITRATAAHFGGTCTIRRAGDPCAGVDVRGNNVATVPLVAFGTVLGALVAVRDTPYLPDDLTLLEEIGARAALVMSAVRSHRSDDSAHQLRMIADALPVLVSYVGRDFRYEFVNRAYGEWFGLPLDQLVGRTVEDVLGAEAAAWVRPHLTTAMGGEAVSYASEIRQADGPTRHTAIEYVPHRGSDGDVHGVVVLVREVTEARRAAERAGFLADASRVLSSSLDVDTALRSLAEVAVPRLADLSVIQIVGDDGIRHAHTIHAEDPAVVEQVRSILERWPADSPDRLPRAFRSNEHDLVPQVTDTMLVRAARDADHLAALRSLGIASALVVPIPTSLGTHAALTLQTTTSRRRFDEDDVALAREIAARTGLAIDNARLLREAREADRAKDEFLAMLAHELRNPLATIMTGLELVGELGSPSPGVQRTLGAVERQTTKLARLVDDLLDVSRITRGKIELRCEGCRLHTLIGRSVDATRSLLEARQHTLVVDVPEDVPLFADPVRIEQVFANLLNNAAKYTEPGGHVRIEAHRNGDRVSIVVSDDGIGIPVDVLPHVFQPFRQGTIGLDRSYGGLGLGLTLVERLVAMHGGTVEARSGGTGHGSTFTVHLPITEGLVGPTVVLPRPSPAARRRRVLIVDDNTDAAVATAELLTVLGHEVEVAHDGPMALRLAGLEAPEVILLDLGLPGMDGYEVASRLRAGGNRARIVALSGYGREQDRRDSQEAGFDGHLVKPVNVHTLLSAIDA